MNHAGVLLLVAITLGCDRAVGGGAVVVSETAQTDSIRARQSRDSLAYVRSNLPRLASTTLYHQGYYDRYDLFLGLNPYYQRGYFDQDSAADVAVQVVEKATGKRGIAIVHGGDSTVYILGAGSPFGNGGDDFRWLWVWRVEPGRLHPRIPSAGREILYVEKPESAGGLIWWNGTAYRWTQHGD